MKKLLLVAFLFLNACSQNPVIEFKNHPCLTPFQEDDFQLCQDFIVTENNHELVVPKGFITDLASVPRILWPIYAPNDAKTIGAAIMHDYLYACPGDRTRASIDAMLYSGLVTGRNSLFTSYVYWLGVRIFGSTHFREGYQCIYVNDPPYETPTYD